MSDNQFTGVFKLLDPEARFLVTINGIEHPPMTSRWFRIREAISAWIAPPAELGQWTSIVVTSAGKIRLRRDEYPIPESRIEYDDVTTWGAEE